jgi:hypothetical protein
MTITDYTCKICGRDSTARYDHEMIKPDQLDHFKSMLTCNPCYDYREVFIRYRDAISMICNRVMVLRQGKPDPEAEQIQRELLEITMKKLVTHVTTRFATVNIYDPEPAAQMFDAPRMWKIILARLMDTLEAAI